MKTNHAVSDITPCPAVSKGLAKVSRGVENSTSAACIWIYLFFVPDSVLLHAAQCDAGAHRVGLSRSHACSGFLDAVFWLAVVIADIR